jgi:long-chain acyl-CoA synthetase
MVKTSDDPNFLANYTERERDFAEHLVDYLDVETLPEIWSWVTKRYPDVVAVNDPDAKPEVVLTYTQLNQKIPCFAAGLQALGVAPAPIPKNLHGAAGQPVPKPKQKSLT